MKNTPAQSFTARGENSPTFGCREKGFTLYEALSSAGTCLAASLAASFEPLEPFGFSKSLRAL